MRRCTSRAQLHCKGVSQAGPGLGVPAQHKSAGLPSRYPGSRKRKVSRIAARPLLRGSGTMGIGRRGECKHQAINVQGESGKTK